MATSPRLAGRYAKSIYSLATEKKVLKEVLADMELIDNSIKGSKDLYLMLQSPIIMADKKSAILNKIFGGKVSDLTNVFINLLTNKGREKQLGEIAAAFVKQYNDANHIATATLTTAIPASDEVIKKVKDLLLSIDDNESVALTTKTDPSVLGGFVLRYGDKLLDSSVQRKLQLIKKEIQDTSYINKL